LGLQAVHEIVQKKYNSPDIYSGMSVLSEYFTGFMPTQILPFLYLGGSLHANDHTLSKLKIINVLNVAEDVETNLDPSIYKISKFSLKDDASTRMLDILDQCIDIIAAAKAKGERVLVNCAVGVNRSPAVVIGFLMKYEKMTCRDAFLFVRSRRICIHPQPAYIDDLQEYEHTLHAGIVSTTLSEYNDLMVLLY